MNMKNTLLTIIILAVGAWGVTKVRDLEPAQHDAHGHGGEEEHADEFERGPNGGRLLRADAFSLEITIFEDGVPPHFRVYPYRDNIPLATQDVGLNIVLSRLGNQIDKIEFVSEQEYLRGLQVVYEPHSFDVVVQAKWGETEHEFTYESHEGRVHLSPQAADFAGIAIDTIKPRKIQEIVSLPGVIRMNEDSVVHVVPRISGVVRSVHKNYGENVAEGEVLAIIDSRELADAKSEYLAARERGKLMKSRFVREEDLYQRKISSEDDYLSAKEKHAESKIRERTARQKLIALGLSTDLIDKVVSEPDASLTEYVIRAPLTGSVIEKHITGGEGVAADSDVFLLADLSTVWVEVSIYPQDLKKMKPGLPVTVRSDDLDDVAHGVIAHLDPVVGQNTRTARAIVELSNPEAQWKPGLYVTAEILTKEFDVPMAIPVTALQQFRDWQVVFAKFGDRYEVRMMQLGQSDGVWVEVLSGIEPGQEFVSENSYALKADLEKAGATHDH
jgi:cobalt-zinc-cadmium efflux system membrane fusion protein